MRYFGRLLTVELFATSVCGATVGLSVDRTPAAPSKFPALALLDNPPLPGTFRVDVLSTGRTVSRWSLLPLLVGGIVFYGSTSF